MVKVPEGCENKAFKATSSRLSLKEKMDIVEKVEEQKALVENNINKYVPLTVFLRKDGIAVNISASTYAKWMKRNENKVCGDKSRASEQAVTMR